MERRRDEKQRKRVEWKKAKADWLNHLFVTIFDKLIISRSGPSLV